MDFSLSPHEEAFRDELRAWLATNLPEHRTVHPPSDDELSLSQIWGDHPQAPEAGRWAFQTLFANRFGIAGGTDQIQRSIIGERLLGLPR